MRLPNWNLLIAFETVARHGSFSRAAVELNVLRPAVSRRVALLEQDLGVRLINRSRPAATLTTDGQILFRAVTGSMAQVQMAVQQIRRAPYDCTLAVSTTIGFANCFLMRRLNAFRDLYPDTAIELISRDMNDGYRTEDCDVVTVFDSPDRLPGLTQIKIFEERMIAVCAPVYLEHNALVDEDFSGHHLLHLRAGIHGEDWRIFLGSLGQSMPSPNSAQRYTSFMVYLQAAINGDGIAIGWCFLLDDLLASGQLVKVIDHELATERGYFCCVTERGRGRAEAKRFTEWCESLVG